MLNEHPVNTCYYLLDHLSDVAKQKSDDKGDIVVGGTITYIAGKFGIGIKRGINRIEGNHRLDLETLILMFFVRHYGEPCQRTYELRVNMTQTFIILANPDRTNTRVAENLLYVVNNPQVPQDHGDDEKVEGGDLNDDAVQQDQETSGQFDNDRWAWMETEI